MRFKLLVITLLFSNPAVADTCRTLVAYRIDASKLGLIKYCGKLKDQYSLRLKIGVQPMRSTSVSAAEFKIYLSSIHRLQAIVSAKRGKACAGAGKLVVGSLDKALADEVCMDSRSAALRQAEDLVIHAYKAL